MNLFESILLFTRATREESWILHLSSLHKLCPYFFSFDMINYTCMAPVYLLQKTMLKKDDKRKWRLMLTGGFCVRKSKDPFLSIGADYAIEPENRAIKVVGGIKGIGHLKYGQIFLINSRNRYIITSFS